MRSFRKKCSTGRCGKKWFICTWGLFQQRYENSHGVSQNFQQILVFHVNSYSQLKHSFSQSILEAFIPIESCSFFIREVIFTDHVDMPPDRN